MSDAANPPEGEQFGGEHDPTGLDAASDLVRRLAGTKRTGPPPPPRRHRRSDGIERRSGARPDDRDPQLIGSVLNKLGSDRGWQRRISLSTVLRSWGSIVGADNAEHSKPVSYDKGVLVVECDSTAWATGMRFAAAQIVARLNASLGQQTVLRIDVRGPEAPSWKKGPRSVRDGRGPRDTYG